MLIELEMLVFGAEGGLKTGEPGENPGARQLPARNSTHIWHRAGIEPRTHRLLASALTAAPSLLHCTSPIHSLSTVLTSLNIVEHLCLCLLCYINVYFVLFSGIYQMEVYQE